MKNLYNFPSLLIFLFMSVNVINAQKTYIKGENRYSLGGLAYVSGGYSFVLGNGLKDNLERSYLLDESLPDFGFNYGGGLTFLFAKKFIVSGNGFGLSFQNVINKSNEMSFSGGGGGAAIGYVVYGRYDWLVYPSVGFNTTSLTMNIRNTSDSLIHYGNSEIPISTNADFKLSNTNLDISVNAYKVIRFGGNSDGTSGMTLGLSLGYLTGFGDSNWTDSNGSDVSGIEPEKFSSIYIKLSVGGALFFLK